jgi:hypothetical protein
MSVPVQPSTANDQALSERSGLNKVLWFGIIQLVGIVTGWVVSFYAFRTIFTTSGVLSLPVNPTPAQVADALRPMFQALSYAVPVMMIVQLVAIVILAMGFRDLRKFDHDAFSVPSTLILVMIAGVLVAAAGVFPLFNSISDVIAKAPMVAGVTPSSDFIAAIGSLILDFLVVGIGGLLVLVGLIGGQILGLWRVGSRYDQIVIKLGAIFAVVPYLNVAAPVLVLVGAYQAKERLNLPR